MEKLIQEKLLLPSISLIVTAITALIDFDGLTAGYITIMGFYALLAIWYTKIPTFTNQLISSKQAVKYMDLIPVQRSIIGVRAIALLLIIISPIAFTLVVTASSPVLKSLDDEIFQLKDALEKSNSSYKYFVADRDTNGKWKLHDTGIGTVLLEFQKAQNIDLQILENSPYLHFKSDKLYIVSTADLYRYLSEEIFYPNTRDFVLMALVLTTVLLLALWFSEHIINAVVNTRIGKDKV